MSLTKVSYSMISGAAVNVIDYGADNTGVADSTSAIQAAILFAANSIANSTWQEPVITGYTNSRVVNFPSGVYRIQGTIYVPTSVILNGNNSTLVGNGMTSSDNNCFESGYISGGVIISNIGTPAESQRLEFNGIQGFRFTKFKRAINLQNYNVGSYVRDCQFTDCLYFVYADKCFYTELHNLNGVSSTGNLATPTEAGFYFTNAVNAVKIKGCTANGRFLGLGIDGGSLEVDIQDCTFENCTNGILVQSECYSVSITNCYFEIILGNAINFAGGSQKRGTLIDNNWFDRAATAITGTAMIGGLIGNGNTFSACPNTVTITDLFSTIKVVLNPVRTAGNVSSYPYLPAELDVGRSVNVVYPQQVFNNISGETILSQDWAPNSPLVFSGRQGYVANSVPFCGQFAANTSSFAITIDTAIAYDPYVMYIFALTFSDGVGSYVVNGRGYGPTVIFDTNASSKTVAVSAVDPDTLNPNGYLRLTFNTFSNPGLTGGFVEGIVRLV